MHKNDNDFNQVEGSWEVLQALTGIYFNKEMYCFINFIFLLLLPQGEFLPGGRNVI